MCKFQGSIKNRKWNFQKLSRKNHMEIPWVLVFDKFKNFRGLNWVFAGTAQCS